MVVRSYVRLNLFLRLPKQNIRELDRGPSPWFCGYRTRMRELNPHLPVRTALSLVSPQYRQAINDQSCRRSQHTLGSGRIAGSMFGP